MRPARSVRRDPAVRDAHEVVGLYGDPDTSWGIAVDLAVRDLDTEARGRPTGGAVRRTTPTWAPHRPWRWWARRIGRPGGPRWRAVGYGSAALLRVAVREDGRRLAVGAHHGAVDGLGLIAVAGVALGQPLRTQARGIGDRGARAGFVRSSLGASA